MSQTTIISQLSNKTIKLELDKLKEIWKVKRGSCPYAEFIDSKFSQLERALLTARRKTLRSSYTDSAEMLNEIQFPDSMLGILTHLVNDSDKLTYNEISQWVDNHNSLEVFCLICHKFTDEEYWTNLRHAYVRQDKKLIDFLVYKQLFLTPRKHRHFLMTEEERIAVEKLPPKLRIYRGMSVQENMEEEFGVSWTTKKRVANFFAKRQFVGDRKKMVQSLIIDKSEVIAYFLDRNEYEIIYIYDVIFVSEQLGFN